MCVDDRTGYAIRANISPKTGSSKLKLASKKESKNKNKPLKRNQHPSLVGMNVVNLGEQKLEEREIERERKAN